MWSWDDRWDSLPIAIWHFLPSYSFERHLGMKLSHEYLYNRPIEKIFNRDVEELFPYLDMTSEKRSGTKEGYIKFHVLKKKVTRQMYWLVLGRQFKNYIIRVFSSLG